MPWGVRYCGCLSIGSSTISGSGYSAPPISCYNTLRFNNIVAFRRGACKRTYRAAVLYSLPSYDWEFPT